MGPVHHGKSCSLIEWPAPALTILSLMKKESSATVCACATSSWTLCCAGGVASGLFILSFSCNGSASSFQVLTFLLFSPHAPSLRMSHSASSFLPNPTPLPPLVLCFCAPATTDDQTPAPAAYSHGGPHLAANPQNAPFHLPLLPVIKAV